MIATDRMSHALLFLGAEGCGKLSLALAFAQYVLCQNKTDDDSCGKCPSCIKAAKLIHPDIHFSYPTVGSKAKSTDYLTEWRSALIENPYQNAIQWLQAIGAENKQGNITKDECVDIIKKLSLKIFEGSHKILIMWLPEYLGKEGNRLLKMIEEPPANTLFILVAENQEKILNTILSRCQIVKINPLKDEEVAQALMDKKNTPEENAAAIAHLAEGNFNEALNLLENTENDNAILFLEWMRLCYQADGLKVMNWVERFSKIGRENQKHFLKYGLHFMREYMQLKLTGVDNVRLLPNELKTAQNLTKIIEWNQIEAITNLFNDCFYYVERNANPRILFLDASLQLNKILKTKIKEMSDNSNGGCGSGGCNKLNTYDWLSRMDLPDSNDFGYVEVSFKNGSRKSFYHYSPHSHAVTGDMVVVESGAGMDVGKISLSGDLVRLQMKKKNVDQEGIVHKIVRRANERDLEKLHEARSKEKQTMIKARIIARKLELDMKIGDVEYQGDKRKATFFYTAEGRVDFRELIKQYAKEFRVKIEMRQIGARQESSRIGGIGSCGRELCCSTWLTDFRSVSTAAARYQNLAINQTKLSGQCGRLKCCLNFEY